MPPLTAAGKARRIELIEADKPLPAAYRAAFFGSVQGGRWAARRSRLMPRLAP